jgi:hypothetical protein
MGVALSTVQLWVKRAGDRGLEEVDWSDGSRAPHRTRRIPVELEDAIVALRGQLRQSVLGEHGAVAIRATLSAGDEQAPSVRTIGRVLERRGLLDGRRRLRRPAPPPGWYLPPVGQRHAELDSFDFVESLKIQDGPLVDVFTGVSLHGGLTAAWPRAVPWTGPLVVEALLQHWTEVGLPGYAQFDNDPRFHGSHGHRDHPGPLIRRCLTLGVVPVFAPVSEHGIQAAIESFNGRWQTQVWNRYRVASVTELAERSAAYVAEHRRRKAARIEAAPARRPVPHALPPAAPEIPTAGTVIYLRRTSERGSVSILGRTYSVDQHWLHRLVRAELDYTGHRIRFFALRRRDPTDQPLLAEMSYVPHPERRYRE